MKKTFRAVRIDGHAFRYRVDQRHTLLFGLIKYWDRGAACLSPRYYFNSPADVASAISTRYPGSIILWQ